jgi:hypothetical protein
VTRRHRYASPRLATRRLAPLLLPVLAAAVLGAAMSPAGATRSLPAGSASSSWTLKLAIQYLPTTNHSQYDAVVVEPGEVWLLGGSDVGGHGHPVAERLVNGVPQQVQLPSGPHSWITAASALSPHAIWAVTALGGSVLTWNGSAWAVATRGAWKSGTRFTGITAISATDVWVFGTAGRLHPGAGTWHWNGSTWNQAGGAAGGIYQASKASATDLWAVGEAGGTMSALLHRGGKGWQRVRPAALAGFTYTRVLALARHNVWVAGSVAGSPELGHFNGTRWTALTMTGNVAATGLCPDGQGGLWVIANTGTSPSRLLHRSASGTWTTSTVSSVARNEVLACSLVPGTTVTWGAGKAAAPQGSAAAAYRHG